MAGVSMENGNGVRKDLTKNFPMIQMYEPSDKIILNRGLFKG